MTIKQLAKEYEQQEEVCAAKVNALTPLLDTYTGTDLIQLCARLNLYEDMMKECHEIAKWLNNYCRRVHIENT